jgi:hypothetical protein
VARPKSKFDKLVVNNRLANSYARSFDQHRKRLDEFDREVSQNMTLGKQPSMALFKVLANAAQDLHDALMVLEGAEPVEIVRKPAADLCGAIRRVVQSLGEITPNAGPG